MKYLAAAIVVGISGISPAYGEGKIVQTAIETMGRNPEVADRAFTSMVVGCAITESTAIYGLVTGLILLFVA